MVTLRRIGVQSAGRMGFWLGIAFATINISIILIFLLLVARVPLAAFGLNFWVRVALSISLAGVQGAFTWGMFAFVYNMAANAGGGLELEFDMPGTSTNGEKRKNEEVEITSSDSSDDDEDVDANGDRLFG